jgi:hypothetical protein
MLIAAAVSLPAAAVADRPEWQVVPGLTSANLAASKWELVGSSGLSWPDGRQAIVSFWASENPQFTFRCTKFFDASMRSTGEKCEQPVNSDGE